MALTFKWTVTTNVLADGTYIYQVYRNRFRNEPDHSGNREYRGGVFSSEEDAQNYADTLNNLDAHGRCEAAGYTAEQNLEAVKIHFASRNNIEPEDVTAALAGENERNYIFRVKYSTDKTVELSKTLIERLTALYVERGYIEEQRL